MWIILSLIIVGLLIWILALKADVEEWRHMAEDYHDELTEVLEAGQAAEAAEARRPTCAVVGDVFVPMRDTWDDADYHVCGPDTCGGEW